MLVSEFNTFKQRCVYRLCQVCQLCCKWRGDKVWVRRSQTYCANTVWSQHKSSAWAQWDIWNTGCCYVGIILRPFQPFHSSFCKNNYAIQVSSSNTKDFNSSWYHCSLLCPWVEKACPHCEFVWLPCNLPIVLHCGALSGWLCPFQSLPLIHLEAMQHLRNIPCATCSASLCWKYVHSLFCSHRAARRWLSWARSQKHDWHWKSSQVLE